MNPRVPSSLREFEQWLSASLAEADAVLPDLLELPAPLLVEELRSQPRFRTPGVLKRILAAARHARDRYPSRAHELTSIVTRYARSMPVPPAFAFVSRTLQGEAWRDHASALHAMGRAAKAARAIRTARAFFQDTPGADWQSAIVDLVEAPLLHERGLHGEALVVARRAADWFGRARDDAHYLEACMLECWMLRAAGDREGAQRVWKALDEGARFRGNGLLTARTAAKLARFALRDGSAEEALELLTNALTLFEAAGAQDEAVRARWSAAECAAALGRLHEAVSEYHKVRAQLLARGSLTNAALASVESLQLLLLAGREPELPSLTTTFVETFRDAGMPINGIEALAYLRGRAAVGELTREDVVCARRFFEDLPLDAKARFRAP
jgi:tetratricopeptide (TPR) repeat protein